MYARVGKVTGNNIEKVIDYLDNASDEGYDDLNGFFILVDENKEKILTLTLWETKEEAESSLPAAMEIYKDLEKMTGEPSEVELYEVALQS